LTEHDLHFLGLIAIGRHVRVESRPDGVKGSFDGIDK
jgi:hypothetical protein